MLENLFEIPGIEILSSDKVESIQFDALKKTLEHVSKHSVFYKNHFAKHGVDIGSIQRLQDLHKIPLTDKVDLQKNNLDFLCESSSKIIDYSTTTGTTGEPVVIGLTENDLQRLAYNEAISLATANGNQSDIYMLTTTIDRRFMAGLAYFLGVRKLGCGIVRVGAGVPQLQIDTIKSIKPTTIIAVPSFIVKLIEYAKSIGYDLNQSSVQKIICIGESIRNVDFSPNSLCQRIENNWQVKLYSTYASTEMSTAYTECSQQQGGHEHPHLVISELIDENGQVISNQNEYGELCITTLGVEGTPLIRFKTGDIVRFYHEKCSCGRTTKRISPVIGRKNQMIKYKGTTLYPPAIMNVLNAIEAVKNYVIEVNNDEFKTDQIIIYLFIESADFESALENVKALIQAKVRVKPTLIVKSNQEIVELQTKGNLRKPMFFIDKRL